MRILGLRTFRDKIIWASVEGDDRTSAIVSNNDSLQFPSDTRSAQLHWLRQEIASLVAQEKPGQVVLCAAEGNVANTALIERAQVGGIAIEVLYDLSCPTALKKSATIRASFKAKSNAELNVILDQLDLRT